MFHILRIHQEDLAAPRLSPDSALLYRGYAPSLCSSERCLYLLYAARERGLPPDHERGRSASPEINFRDPGFSVVILSDSRHGNPGFN